MSKKLYVKKINDEFTPEYMKGWHEANSQFWVNKDRLYIDYEDDHDEEGLHDVSSQYEWEIRNV